MSRRGRFDAYDKINRIIEEGKGKHFDPDLVDIFFKEKDKILRIKKKLSI